MKTRKARKNRIKPIGLILAAMAFGVTGCGKETPTITETVMEGVESSLSEDRGITMYFVEGSSIKTRPERLQPKQPDSLTGCLEEVMSAFSLTEGIHYLNYSVGAQNAVTLAFQVDDTVSMETALLEKAALVSTISQIKGMGSITLSLDYGSGKPEVEELKSSTFYYYDNVIPTGQNTGRFTLYLPDDNGETDTGLEEQSLSVTLQLDVSVEEEVIRQLLERKVFPEGTRFYSVSVIQRVAYVDLSEEFLNVAHVNQVASLVDSVSALPHIGSVQILINGEKKEEIGGLDTHVPLRFFYPANVELEKKEKSSEEG